MISFQCLNTLKGYSPDLAKTFRGLGFAIKKYDLFMTVLGGDVHIVDEYPEMDSLMKSLGTCIDVIAPSVEGQWMTVCQITNNAGGHTYCFPRDSWDKWLRAQPKKYQEFVSSLTDTKE